MHRLFSPYLQPSTFGFHPSFLLWHKIAIPPTRVFLTHLIHETHGPTRQKPTPVRTGVGFGGCGFWWVWVRVSLKHPRVTPDNPYRHVPSKNHYIIRRENPRDQRRSAQCRIPLISWQSLVIRYGRHVRLLRRREKVPRVAKLSQYGILSSFFKLVVAGDSWLTVRTHP